MTDLGKVVPYKTTWMVDVHDQAPVLTFHVYHVHSVTGITSAMVRKLPMPSMGLLVHGWPEHMVNVRFSCGRYVAQWVPLGRTPRGIARAQSSHDPLKLKQLGLGTACFQVTGITAGDLASLKDTSGNNNASWLAELKRSLTNEVRAHVAETVQPDALRYLEFSWHLMPDDKESRGLEADDLYCRAGGLPLCDMGNDCVPDFVHAIVDTDPYDPISVSTRVVDTTGMVVHTEKESVRLGGGAVERLSACQRLLSRLATQYNKKLCIVIRRRLPVPGAHHPSGSSSGTGDNAEPLLAQRAIPPDWIIVTQTVVERIRDGDAAYTRDVIRAATHLCRLTGAPLNTCLFHLLNEGTQSRAARLVDGFLTKIALRNGMSLIPYPQADLPSKGHLAAAGWSVTKRSFSDTAVGVDTSNRSATLDSMDENTCDGLDMANLQLLGPPPAKRARMIRSGDLTRDGITVMLDESAIVADPVPDAIACDHATLAGGTSDGSDGGSIVDAIQGLHLETTDHLVVQLDARAYYVSIMIASGLCPTVPIHECMALGRKSRELPLPRALIDIVQLRQAAKEHGNRALDRALKILQTCTYGVLGLRTARFYAPHLRSATARMGRRHIECIRAEIEQFYGGRVIQSITDDISCYFTETDLVRFRISSAYCRPDPADVGPNRQNIEVPWIRLGEPTYMTALFVATNTARAWIPRGATAVTRETCRGMYPNQSTSEATCETAFLEFLTALLMGTIQARRDGLSAPDPCVLMKTLVDKCSVAPVHAKTALADEFRKPKFCRALIAVDPRFAQALPLVDTMSGRTRSLASKPFRGKQLPVSITMPTVRSLPARTLISGHLHAGLVDAGILEQRSTVQ